MKIHVPLSLIRTFPWMFFSSQWQLITYSGSNSEKCSLCPIIEEKCSTYSGTALSLAEDTVTEQHISSILYVLLRFFEYLLSVLRPLQHIWHSQAVHWCWNWWMECDQRTFDSMECVSQKVERVTKLEFALPNLKLLQQVTLLTVRGWVFASIHEKLLFSKWHPNLRSIPTLENFMIKKHKSVPQNKS